MDTILNVGLTPVSIRGMLAKSGNPRFVYDTYRRFLENFGVCVFGHDPREYHRMLQDALLGEDVADERELDFQGLRTLCTEYSSLYVTDAERSCIADARRQLESATVAILRSWMSPRALEYRRIHGIGESVCTAVTVQAMVYGNLGAGSGAGVAFTRNPWTGTKDLLIDFRFGAQGEDVVSGARSAITQMQLAEILPDVYREILQIGARLEEQYRDMQDLEFTVQEGRLFILQSRTGKRSPPADLRIIVELCEEGIIGRQEAWERAKKIPAESLELQEVRSDAPPIAHGISASGGVAQGSIAFSAERAILDRVAGPVILVREAATPDDIAGIEASAGILTARGARTSHAAVVARHMGKVCVVNCTDLHIDPARHRCTIGGFPFREGDTISIDGTSGAVFGGTVQVVRQRPEELLAKVRQWESLA
jgi:pyruvate, orthophosphate dikinase